MMSTDVKSLQQIAEAAGSAGTLDWSTISHTHGGGAARVGDVGASANLAESLNVIKQLQQIPQAASASPMEWSTISNTHTK
jgi:hypothetical protein